MKKILSISDKEAALELKFNEGIKVGKKEWIHVGEERDRKTEKIEVAKNLLKTGISIKIIVKTTGLTIDKVKGLI